MKSSPATVRGRGCQSDQQPERRRRHLRWLTVVLGTCLALFDCKGPGGPSPVVVGRPRPVSAIVLFSIGSSFLGKDRLGNGQIIRSGEWIRVSGRSLLDLQLRDTAAAVTVRLRPGAQFRFQATENGGRLSHTLELAAGSALFNVEKLTALESIAVITPTSRQDVRGTKFKVDVEGNGTSRTEVYEGSVSARLRIPEVENLPSSVIARSEVLSAVVADSAKGEKTVSAGSSVTFERQTAEKILKAAPKLAEVLSSKEVKTAVAPAEKLNEDQAASAGRLIDDYFKGGDSKEKVTSALDKAIAKETVNVKPEKLSAGAVEREIREYDELVAVDQQKIKDEKSAREIVATRVQKQSQQLAKRIEKTMGRSQETLTLVGGGRIHGVIEQRGQDYVVHTPSGPRYLKSNQVSGFSF